MRKDFLIMMVVLCAVIFAVKKSAMAAGAPDYNPDNPHPRIWVNVADLRAKATANTAEFQALKTRCDSPLDAYSQTSGYQFMNWHSNVLNYAACYLATGDETYADKSATYLQALLNDKTDVGDGLGGDSSIQTDSGWTARTLAAVAIGRDWLDGSTALTPTLINQINSRLTTWITWTLANGYANADPRDNYYAGYFSLIFNTAIACYGDSGYQSSWLSTARSMWTNTIVPAMHATTGIAIGKGDWPQGWNYGPWAALEYMQYPLAMQTGASDFRPWADTTYPDDAVVAQVNMLYPSRDHMSDDGVWSGDVSAKGDPSAKTLMMFLASVAHITSAHAQMARWYENAVTTSRKPDLYESFLWGDSSNLGTIPSKTSLGSLGWYSGRGHTIVRSDNWSNTSATIIDVMGRGPEWNGEEDRNQGEIKIASREVQLLTDSDSWETESDYANVPLVTGTHTYAPDQEWWRDRANTSVHYFGDTYSVIRVDGLDSCYDRNHADLQYYTREILFVPPDYTFVYDNMDVTQAGTNVVTWQWNFMGTPTISGNTATTTNGAGKITMTALGEPLSLSSIDMSAHRPGVYKVEATDASAPQLNQVVTVFETMGSTATPKTASLVDGMGIRGAVINGTAALFTKSTTGAEITSASYTADATSQFISDLPPDTVISVTRNGSTIVDAVNSGSAGAINFSSASGSADYVLTAGEATYLPPPTGNNIFRK